MAVLVLLVLILSITAHSSGNWCVCKQGMGDAVLQKTLDYACGAGADCNPIHQNGACYQPNTVKAHCSYAVNSFFQKKAQAQGSCEFAGTALISTSDPSATGCAYPSSTLSSAGTRTIPTPTTNTTPYSATPTPYTATPTGVLGGIGTGVGPSGAGINTDVSDGGFRIQNASFFSLFITFSFSGLMLCWG